MKVALAALALIASFIFPVAAAHADPGSDCHQYTGRLTICADSQPQGMTPDQIKQCCLSGNCVDGGVDLANGKTIICDPLKAIGPGDEGF